MTTKTTEPGVASTPVTDIAAGINPFDTSAQAPQPPQAAVDVPVTTDTAAPPPPTDTPTTPAAPLPTGQAGVEPQAAAATKEEPIVTPVTPPVADTPAAPEFSFANEYSKQLFDYLREGKTDEVLQFLNEQKTLSSVEAMEAEAAIRLRLKYDNPDFSDDEIEGLYEEQFARPEKPEQAVDELDEEYGTRLAKWEKKHKAFENKLSRESKSAKKVLLSKKNELILPSLPTGQAGIQPPAAPKPTAEQLAQQAAAQQVAAQAYYQSIEQGVAAFNGYTTEVEFDKGVKFPVSYNVDATEKAAFTETLKNFNVNEYFGKRWLNADQSFNGQQFTEDVYKIVNFDTMFKRAASEGANRRLEEYIKGKHNVDFSGGKQQPITTGTGDVRDQLAEFFVNVR